MSFISVDEGGGSTNDIMSAESENLTYVLPKPVTGPKRHTLQSTCSPDQDYSVKHDAL